MEAAQRKKISIITRYAVEKFSQGDWLMLGQITGQLPIVQQHPRLLRSMDFGDDDYEFNAADVLTRVFDRAGSTIEDVVEHFDIAPWYEQKHPDQSRRVFGPHRFSPPKFWRADCLRVFISHLARSRKKVGGLKVALERWGTSCFIAHQDIEPSLEWQGEIEAGLATMDVLVALLEPGFRESAWTDQEVGAALGRGVDVVPVLVGVDPHGFIGKIQGIQAKDRLQTPVAEDVALALLKRHRHRTRMLPGMARYLVTATSEDRRSRIHRIEELLTDEELKALLEAAGLSADDKAHFAATIERVGAFKLPEEPATADIPF